MREEQLKISIFKILKEDQQALVYSVAVLLSLVLNICNLCAIFFHAPLLVSNSYLIFVSVAGAIALPLLIWRLLIATHLRKHGQLVKGYIKSSRYTAYGHCEINYTFNFQGKEVHENKEIVKHIIASTNAVWLIVSPQNPKIHMIVDLSMDQARKEAEDVTRNFENIRNEWKQKLVHLLDVDEINWTKSKPDILVDEGISFLFKEFNLVSKPTRIIVDSEPSVLTIQVTRYAVAIRDGIGGWKPTDIFFLSKDTPEEAMAEMRSLRERELRANMGDD